MMPGDGCAAVARLPMTTTFLPWLRFYGRVPASIDYPRVTLYEAVAATAARVPEAIAIDFFGARSTYRELLAAIDAALAAAPAAVWLERLDSLGVPAGKVRSLDEVYGWEQTRAQGLVISADHPVLGRSELPGPPLRFGDRPYAGGRQTHLPPPALGAHDVSVRAWLSEEGARRA